MRGHRLMKETYDVIYMDPPWSYYGSGTKMGAAAKEYDLMSDQELLDLEVPLSDPGVLFMWATSPRLDFAFQLLSHWGLHYRGVAFNWVKTKKTDPASPIGAQGVRPSIVKPTSEFVLAASNRQYGRPLKLSSESVRQVVMAPKREHSRKPEEVVERIEQLYPNATKLEMFARTVRDGWSSHGNELDKFPSLNLQEDPIPQEDQ